MLYYSLVKFSGLMVEILIFGIKMVGDVFQKGSKIEKN